MVDRQLLREFVEVAGILSMYLMSVLFLSIWTAAYLGGGEVLVMIDLFGEQYPELILWAVMVPIMTLALHSYLRTEVH